MMKRLHLRIALILLFLSISGCKNTGTTNINAGGTSQSEANQPSALSSAKAKRQVHAFKVVSVNNNLKFAILQNVTGLAHPVGEQLEVFRGSEFVGLLIAGDQADETFLSADIIEGQLKRDDLAFLITPEKTAPVQSN